MNDDKEYQVIEKSEKKSKTKLIIGAFLATALLLSSCSTDSDKENTNTEQTAADKSSTEGKTGQRLKDDNGNEYTLYDNGDGTETAKYDDGRSVTFQRQEDGSLDFLSGTAGLIAGLAAGYYLFHGFSNTGTWDSARNRYTVSEPLKRKDDKNNPVAGGATSSKSNTSSTSSTSTKNSSTTNSSTTNSTANKTPATSESSKVNLSKDSSTAKSSSSATSSSSTSSAKSGFGSAGARSSSSS